MANGLHFLEWFWLSLSFCAYTIYVGMTNFGRRIYIEHIVNGFSMVMFRIEFHICRACSVISNYIS